MSKLFPALLFTDWLSVHPVRAPYDAFVRGASDASVWLLLPPIPASFFCPPYSLLLTLSRRLTARDVQKGSGGSVLCGPKEWPGQSCEKQGVGLRRRRLVGTTSRRAATVHPVSSRMRRND
ncbi:hypothetical protein C8R46DRAFT_518977 [Mycena filopes]|nr:hypothetical protein C8R46DRAFT_518977 [Mycena filopes]